jgi:hypothetical protein
MLLRVIRAHVDSHPAIVAQLLELLSVFEYPRLIIETMADVSSFGHRSADRVF